MTNVVLRIIIIIIENFKFFKLTLDLNLNRNKCLNLQNKIRSRYFVYLNEHFSTYNSSIEIDKRTIGTHYARCRIPDTV